MEKWEVELETERAELCQEIIGIERDDIVVAERGGQIGLDEIEVTQQSSDGGLDLKCIKHGIDELTDLDSVKYYVQAKRYKPDSLVSIESVRALRGIMPDGFKGIFITTGRFSKSAYEFAANS